MHIVHIHMQTAFTQCHGNELNFCLWQRNRKREEKKTIEKMTFVFVSCIRSS